LSTQEQGLRPSQPRILAIIPAYNEATRIKPVITTAAGFFPVLVVDDGSADETASVARAAGAEVLVQEPNQGKGAALKAGFEYALAQDFEAVITLDADGQHDPAEIPLFIETYTASAPDLVIGKRNFDGMPPLRRVANTLGQATFSWAIGQNVPDNQSGYRLLSRRLMAGLGEGVEQGFEFELEMIVTCIRLGYRLESVPIRTIYAGETSHINNRHHLTNFLRVTWQTRQARQRNP
jgi:glycosyltransferase involved in cell wall biosynthesis